jgi:hypothetical protein
MAQGPSGKLVIEIDPVLKKALYKRLLAEDKSMKNWFIERAEEYLRAQQTLPLSTPYPARVDAEYLAVAETATAVTRFR